MKEPTRQFTLALSILLLLLLCTHAPLSADDKTEDLRVNSKRIEERIQKLSQYGSHPQGGTNRVAYSKADVEGRKYVMSLMSEAGLTVTIDAAGNMIGRCKGKNADLPPIVFGSHIDTVPEGGNFDGSLGVIAAIESVQVLHESKVQTDHSLEVIAFSDEEGGLVGSRALTGDLTDEFLEIDSYSGKTIKEGIRFIGGNPKRLSDVLRKDGDIRAFIELHIEQGANLYSKQIPIGVVEGIVGINWWDVTITGAANHAGTTPMDNRKDAMLAAAHLTVAVNAVATSIPGSQVATVGRIFVEPGAPNVIPGKVVMSLEIRDLSSKKIDTVFSKVKEEARRIERETGTTISFAEIDVVKPTPTNEHVRSIIAEAAKSLGLRFQFMASGAGHDAQVMAKVAPMGMIFVPSVDGISHSPKEFTNLQDMVNGANVLLHSILKIDESIFE